MSAYARHDLGYFSRRSTTLFLVASLHAALFYGLVTTLAPHGTVVQTPFQTHVVENPLPRTLPPALPKPQLAGTKIDASKPEFEVPSEPDPSRDVMILPEPSRSTPPVSPGHVVKQVPGGPGMGFPNADDFYPDLARRMQEQGVATVRVCVDAKGRLTSDPTTLQGTGSSRLDEGALRLARAGSGHYRATTEDGQPVNSCYPFRIRFQLKN